MIETIRKQRDAAWTELLEISRLVQCRPDEQITDAVKHVLARLQYAEARLAQIGKRLDESKRKGERYDVQSTRVPEQQDDHQ
jgi:DNA repair ATPase RecN